MIYKIILFLNLKYQGSGTLFIKIKVSVLNIILKGPVPEPVILGFGSSP